MKQNSWLLLLPLLISLLTACGQKVDQQQTQTLSVTDSLKTAELDEIISTFPSPLQLAKLLKNAGARHKEGLMNPAKNVSKYQTTEARAVNLGVYSANMAYSHVFSKRQDALKYLSAVRQLSEDLNLSGIFDKKLENAISENEDNPDSLSKLFAETLSRVKIRLVENKQGEILNLMFSGAFIEGLYIATHLYEENASEAMAQQIAEQKLNLQRLMRQVELYKNEGTFIKMYSSLELLTSAYDGVMVEYQAPDQPTEAEAGKVAMIGGSNRIGITNEQIARIQEVITPIRNQFTN